MSTQRPTARQAESLSESRLRRAALGDVLSRQAARQPTRDALVSLDGGGQSERLTYRELESLTNRLAHQLIGHGATTGAMVSVMASNSRNTILTYLAVLKTGATYTTLNPALTVREATFQLQQTNPVLLIVEAAALSTALAATAAAACEPQFVLMDAEGVGVSCPTVDNLIATEHDDGEPSVAIDELDDAMVIFTSGTEDRPKGVRVPHRNFQIATTPAWAYTRYIVEDDVFLLLAPMFTMAGVGTVTNLIGVGATIVLVPRPDPDLVLEVISSEGVTNLAQTPTFFRRLLQSAAFDQADLSSLRQCHVYGGLVTDHVIEEVSKAAPNMVWATYWGQTELSQLGSIGFFRSIEDIPGRDLRWIGRPVPQVECRVVDESGVDAEVGELICRSPAVMPGYHAAPAATARAIRDGWLWTGDHVRRDRDGNLFFLDRRKDVIKTGGMNVSSLEVERVLAGEPSVAEVAVVGVTDPDWTEAVVACVVPATAVTNATELTAHLVGRCRQQLAAYKVPKTILLMTELPHDAQGKIRKRAVRELVREHLERP